MEGFHLAEGVYVKFPTEPVLMHPAKKPDAEGGATPMVVRLKQEGDVFSFVTVAEGMAKADRHGSSTVRMAGRVAFVPKDLSGGEELVVAWVDGRSACLKRPEVVRVKSCGCGVGESCRQCRGDKAPNASMGGQVPARMG